MSIAAPYGIREATNRVGTTKEGVKIAEEQYVLSRMHTRNVYRNFSILQLLNEGFFVKLIVNYSMVYMQTSICTLFVRLLQCGV